MANSGGDQNWFIARELMIIINKVTLAEEMFLVGFIGNGFKEIKLLPNYTTQFLGK